jgi:predicted membrane protein
MKMGFLSSGVFWGAVIVLLGISMLLKAVFHIDVPVFRIIFGLIIIWFGISLMTGWHGYASANTVVFSNLEVFPKENLKEGYSVVFGSARVDLSGADIKEKTVNVKLDTVFGETVIVVDKNMPIKVQVDSVFSGVRMPDGNTVAMGSMGYTSPGYKEGMNCLNIKADVVFGSLRIVGK